MQDVVAAKDPSTTFAAYCQQEVGCPYVTQKHLMILRKQAKLFFEQNRSANWGTLCRTVDWCKARKRRPSHPHWVINLVPYAWKDGFLPELDPNAEDPEVEARIAAALEVEFRDEWQRRLTLARGREARREVIEAWEQDVTAWMVLLSPWPRARSLVEQRRREAARANLLACALSVSTGTWVLTAFTVSSTANSSTTSGAPKTAKATRKTVERS